MNIFNSASRRTRHTPPLPNDTSLIDQLPIVQKTPRYAFIFARNYIWPSFFKTSFLVEIMFGYTCYKFEFK